MYEQFQHLVERRVSARDFIPGPELTEAQVAQLVAAACKAPSAYHLQNWRFIAVRSQAAKDKLAQAAHGQAKVAHAATVFVVCGRPDAHAALAATLAPAVAEGSLPQAVADAWVSACQASHAHDPGLRRDEAIRSAALAAMTLMLAATAMGLASCPMSGFDPQAVARDFALEPGELPVMLVAVGRSAHGADRQKARKPLAEVMRIV